MDFLKAFFGSSSGWALWIDFGVGNIINQLYALLRCLPGFAMWHLCPVMTHCEDVARVVSYPSASP